LRCAAPDRRRAGARKLSPAVSPYLVDLVLAELRLKRKRLKALIRVLSGEIQCAPAGSPRREERNRWN